MNLFSDEIKVAHYLAREAGKVIMQIYSTDFSVHMKGKGDPVTEADKRANDLIVNGLQKEFPNDGIVAEESPRDTAQQGKARVWYVDPLDGTKEFISKNGEFSVMIGLAIDGSSSLGVVYRPDKEIEVFELFCKACCSAKALNSAPLFVEDCEAALFCGVLFTHKVFHLCIKPDIGL